MRIIDFSRFRMFTDIGKERTETMDMRHDVADRIYMNINGMVAHSLSFRIYNSDGPITLNADEHDVLIRLAEIETPAMADSIYANIAEEGQDMN